MRQPGHHRNGFRLLAIAIPLLALGCALGTEAAGVIRYVGPMKACKVAWTDSASGASLGAGQLDLLGNLQVPASPNVIQVSLYPGADQLLRCSDSFSNASVTFPLQASVPPLEDPWASGTLTVNAATTAVSAYLNAGSSALISWTAIDAALLQLYAVLGSDVSGLLPASTPPSTLQLLSLVQSGDRTVRSMGVALMAAESQLSSYLALGACLMKSAAIGSTSAAAIARLSQQLLLAPAPPAGAASILTSNTWIIGALNASISQVPGANLTALTQHIASTAGVIAGLAGVAEPYRAAAAQLMAGVQPAGGLDALDAVVALTQLPSVQALACPAVQSGADDLSSFLPPNVDVVLDAALENYDTILAALGLARTSTPQNTSGVVAAIGPLVNCGGEFDSFLTTTSSSFSTDSLGRYSVGSFSTGRVSVDPRAGCFDAMTNLTLNISMSSFSTPTPVLALNPITILAEGFYRLLASQSLVLPPATLQASAFSAMGLNSQQVPAAFPSSGSAASSTYLAQPVMIATAAASVQLMSLLFSALALFMPSALALEQSTYQAESLVISSTAYAVAKRASSSGGFVNLSDAGVVSALLLQVKQLCSVNSSLLPPDLDWLNASPVLPPPPSPPLKPQPPSPMPAASPSGGRRQALSIRHQTPPESRAPHGSLRAQGAAQSGPGRRRHLLLYTDKADFDGTVKVLSVIVATVANALEPVKLAALAAVGPTSPSPPSPATAGTAPLAFNSTVALLQISRIMVVLQNSYFPQAVSSLQASSFGISSLTSLQNRFANASAYNTSSLKGVPVNVDYICNATLNCVTYAPPPPPPPASKKSSLALALGLGLGLGIPALLLAAYLIYRCCSERALAQSVRSKHAYLTNDQAAAKGQREQQLQQQASLAYSKSSVIVADGSQGLGRPSYDVPLADPQQQAYLAYGNPSLGGVAAPSGRTLSRFSQLNSAAPPLQQQPWAASGLSHAQSHPGYSQSYSMPWHAAPAGVNPAASPFYPPFEPDASLGRTFRQGIVGSLYTGVPSSAHRTAGNSGSSLNGSLHARESSTLYTNPSFQSDGGPQAPPHRLGQTHPLRAMPTSQQSLHDALQQGNYGSWQGGPGVANPPPDLYATSSWAAGNTAPLWQPPRQ